MVPVTIAQYLFDRLKEAGVQSIHGVPGDYNLRLLDFVEPAGLDWVGNCNELNGAYATDGYARVKGLGAMVMTFGVGELSALNGVAGSYAERAPIINIVGAPTRAVQRDGVRIHHSLCNGTPEDFDAFAKMYLPVTVAQENVVDAIEAPGQIDRVIRECLLQSRPVYIRIPMDMVDLEIPFSALPETPDLSKPLVESSPKDLDAAVAAILERIRSAERPLVLADVGAARHHLEALIERLVIATGFPSATTPMGKGVVDETLANFHGVMTPWEEAGFLKYTESSDLVINIGPLIADSNSYYFNTVPDPAKSIIVHGDTISVDGHVHRVCPRATLSSVVEALEQDPVAVMKTYPSLPNPVQDLAQLVSPPAQSPLTQNIFFRRISRFFQSGDIILTDSGTAHHGSREFVLPRNATIITSAAWSSIGYALGAAQCASIAQRQVSSNHRVAGGRTILFQGDGSFQMVAQELSTVLRKKLDMIFFLINNDGYGIERFIHGAEERYNDIASWNYREAVSFFGGKDSEAYPVTTCRVRTWGELDEVTKKLTEGSGRGFHLVELIMEKHDVPDALKKVRQVKSSVKT